MERNFTYNLLDNFIGYDDGLMTPGERLGASINRLATGLYEDPIGMVGAVARDTVGDLNYLMFQGGAEREPERVFGYAAAPMAPGALRGRVANVVSSGGTKPKKGITAYHGSPHEFDRFDRSKAGTGSSDAIDGRGIYLTDYEGEAMSYRRPDLRANPFNPNPKFSGEGHMYEVLLDAADDDFLPTRKPISALPSDVQEIVGKQFRPDDEFAAQRDLSFYLNKNPDIQSDIEGLGYKGFSANRNGDTNFVVFDENLIEIVRKYGIAGAAAMLGISAQELQAQIGGDQ